jgi:glutamate carboxypeptidase
VRRVAGILATVGIAAACPHVAAAQQLAPAERGLARYVDAHAHEAVALLERVVNINSGTMNLAGVRDVGRIFQAQYDSLGFTTRWVDGSAWHRAGHLIAEHPGRGPRIVLIGHLDTVFEASSPFQRFALLPDSMASGPGVIDMKGGDVVMLLALRALKAHGLLDRLNVTVVLHGDEEESGTPLALARHDLIAAGKGADAAIGFEDGDGDPKTAVIARRGFTGWDLYVRGTPAHSSLIFRDEVGAGAIYEAARILDTFYQELSKEPYLTFNPGSILGGSAVQFDEAQSGGTAFGKTNIVAESTVVAGDLRTLSREQRERTKARMQAVVAEHLPHTDAQITFRDTYPPMAPTDGNKRLLALYDRASQDLGLGPVSAVDPANAGAADVSFVADEVPMVIDGVGLMGSGGHTVRETANLRTLPTQTKRAAVLLYRLAAIKPQP